GAGGGGAPAGAVGAVGDRPSALPGAAKDTVPTAAAGDDRQPALDLELGAPPGAGGDRRREWRGRAGGRRGDPRGGGSGCRRCGARFRPPGPLGHRGVRLFALAAAPASTYSCSRLRFLKCWFSAPLLDLYAPEGFETRMLTEDLLRVMKQAGFDKVHLPFETLRWDTN